MKLSFGVQIIFKFALFCISLRIWFPLQLFASANLYVNRIGLKLQQRFLSECVQGIKHFLFHEYPFFVTLIGGRNKMVRKNGHFGNTGYKCAHSLEQK